MRVCVLSPGVVHSIPRTVAIAPYFDSIHFVDISGKIDCQSLIDVGVACYGPADVATGQFNAKQTFGLLDKINPDLIICHFASGSHFFNAINYGKCPVAVIAMGQDVLYDKGDQYIPVLHRLLVRLGLRRAIFIAAKSNILIDRIRSYGVSCPVQLNYWGCDLSRFSAGNSVSARNELNLSTDRPIVLSSRAVEPRLNIDLIVRAVSLVRDKYPDILLVIIGRSDAAYLGEIQKLIIQSGLEQNIEIVGEVTQEKLPQYYIASDIVVSMASSEGFPNTVLEVMGCKVPLLVGKLPQIDELLDDGVHCRICNIDDEEIGRNIINMLENPEGMVEMVRNGKVLVQRLANIKNNGRIFSDELKACVQMNSRAGFFSRAIFRFVYLISRVSARI